MQFTASTPLPEASGAAWMTIDGVLALVVVSDSAHDGAYAIIDPETGATREQGKLPLGKAGDDLEGAAIRIVDGVEHLVALTSAGWIREWTRVDKGFVLVRPAYAAVASDGMCTSDSYNCGGDYEGLCLANKPDAAADACVGFGLSRRRGTLECVVLRDGTYAIDTERTIKISDKGQMGDCAFADDDRLFVGANGFGLDRVWRIDGWRTPTTAKLVDYGSVGVGFSEVIAARGDSLYRMSDLGGDAPSMMARFRCPLR